MAITDGCGGHGRNAEDTAWIRDESCEWCHRHDYNPSTADSLKALSDLIYAWEMKYGGHEEHMHEDGYSYDIMKSSHRRADSWLEEMYAKGFYIVPLPGPCAQCGQTFNVDDHWNIIGDYPNQHPYVVPT